MTVHRWIASSYPGPASNISFRSLSILCPIFSGATFAKSTNARDKTESIPFKRRAPTEILIYLYCD